MNLASINRLLGKQVINISCLTNKYEGESFNYLLARFNESFSELKIEQIFSILDVLGSSCGLHNNQWKPFDEGLEFHLMIQYFRIDLLSDNDLTHLPINENYDTIFKDGLCFDRGFIAFIPLMEDKIFNSLKKTLDQVASEYGFSHDCIINPPEYFSRLNY